MIGSVIDGTYRVVERLGAGAMGEVYLVDHLQLARREAIKVLLPELASDERLAARFRREARAINRLRHPNIVGIYDFGQLPDGRMYITMEYANGQLLDRILEKSPGRRLPMVRVLHLVAQLAGAMGHAHAQGVVHRDLKPSNLMVLTEAGTPDVLKILDFGVAKVLHPEGQTGDELTRGGEMFGTPEYMAPERMGPGADDPRSDLYAIGCIIHELVASTPPFAGNLPFVLMAHMGTTPPKLSSRAPGVPPALDALVDRLLAKSPNDRPASGLELEHALRQILDATPRGPGGAVSAPAIDQDSEKTQLAVPAAATPTSRDMRDQLCEIMVQVAESALAQRPEPQLAAAVQYVREVRNERMRLAAAKKELDAHLATTLQSAREREGSLRFAIADLRFDRSRASSPATLQDVDFQIATLSQRVHEVASTVQQTLRDLEAHRMYLADYERDLDPRWLAAHRHLRMVLGTRVGGVANILDQVL